MPATGATSPAEATCRLLDPGRASRALETAQAVAHRIVDPRHLNTAIADIAGQTQFPMTGRWNPADLAGGSAGLALMCGYVDTCRPGEGWDEHGRRFLTAATRAAAPGALPYGVFGGFAGVAFAAVGLSQEGARYQGLVNWLDQLLIPWAAASAERVAGSDRGMAMSDFDVISGITGVGAYLLMRRPAADVDAALHTTLESLVGLADLAGELPRWWTPHALVGDEDMQRLYPYGNANCGLAHGIPGPLALLGIALRDGVEVAGQAEAIDRLADWIAEHRSDDPWGPNWPSAVPVTAGGTLVPSATLRPTRTAWCYGAPGVARALWIAGDVLGREDQRRLAIEAMEAVFRRPAAVRDIDSPTFCHGAAGLLAVTLRFASETDSATLRDAAGGMIDDLCDRYHPECQLGYVSLEPGGNEVDRPGLLDGAAGIAMVLLAAASDVEPTWDRAFLLA